MPRKALEIDADLYEIAKTYVLAQCDVMEKYGSRPVLTPEKFGEVVRDCAKPLQEIRNWNRKKEAREAKHAPAV